jgi:hypothetical protein
VGTDLTQIVHTAVLRLGLDFDTDMPADIVTTARSVLEEIHERIQVEQEFQQSKLDEVMLKDKLRQLQSRNGLAVCNGPWKITPYPPRQYIPLTTYVPTDDISDKDQQECLQMLRTPLKGFIGQVLLPLRFEICTDVWSAFSALQR